MRLVKPRLRVLPPPQCAVWDELDAIPSRFTLYGGTAIALQLGHRTSVDFDFFAFEAFDPDDLVKEAPLLANAEVLQRASSTLTVIVQRGGPVQLSFFGVPGLGQVEPSLGVEGTSLRLASLIDLAGMKVSVVQKRAEAKDYLDVDALLTAGIDLSLALSAATAIYGPQFNAQIALKALSYFGDGNLRTLPADLRRRLSSAVRGVTIDSLPTVRPLRSHSQ